MKYDPHEGTERKHLNQELGYCCVPETRSDRDCISRIRP